MSRKERCDAHPLEARNRCRECLSDHKAGEHAGAPSLDCPACRVQQRYAELRHTFAVDAMRRAANDR